MSQTVSNPTNNPEVCRNHSDSEKKKIDSKILRQKVSYTEMMNAQNAVMNPEEDMTVMQPDAEEVGGGESKQQSKKKKKEIPTHSHACYGGCCGHTVTTRKLTPFKFQGHRGRGFLRQICLIKYHYMAIYNAMGDECQYLKYENRMRQMTDWFCDMYNHDKKEIVAYLRHRKTKRTYTTADRNYYEMQFILGRQYWDLDEINPYTEWKNLTPDQKAHKTPFEQEIGQILKMKEHFGIQPVNEERDWETYEQERERLGLKKPKKKKAPTPTETEALIASLVGMAADEMMNPTPIAEVEPVAEAKEDMPEAEPERKEISLNRKWKNNRASRRFLQHILPTGFEDESVWNAMKVGKKGGYYLTIYNTDKKNNMTLTLEEDVFKRHYTIKKIKIKKTKKTKKTQSPPQLMI